jgi:hypothetical protein
MMHDPFQTYATLGQHYGMPTQIGLQYPQQLQVNPLAALQLAQAAGIPQQLGQSVFGQNPLQSLVNPQQQQLQLAALVANNPLIAASLLSNPLVAASLHSQGFSNQFGVQQQYPQIGQQIGSPFGQIGYPLPPQSWIGQGVPFGAAQAFGQVNPFQQQVGQRPFQGQGISPWGY